MRILLSPDVALALAIPALLLAALILALDWENEKGEKRHDGRTGQAGRDSGCAAEDGR